MAFFIGLVLLVFPVAPGSLAQPASKGRPDNPSAWSGSLEEEPVAGRTAEAARRDALLLDFLQRSALDYIWRGGDTESGLAFEASFGFTDHPDLAEGERPLAVGGTGFGIAALVVGVERGWLEREAAVARIRKIIHFLENRVPHRELHGAFPHWTRAGRGGVVSFSPQDDGADLVETSFLIQGLLIARAYFDRPGPEADLRAAITRIWQAVDWNWFSAGQNNGLYWHWSPRAGFGLGMKIQGFNECLVTYVLALSSPARSISRQSYAYWSAGPGYQTRTVQGYRLEGTQPGGGPLFFTHYSFIGLDPHLLADRRVPGGYFKRNLTQVLSNRGYCLYAAPPRNLYAADLWGLTASLIPHGYAASAPGDGQIPAVDHGVVAPTAALASMPYTPYYSMQVLRSLAGPLSAGKAQTWGKWGPYDALSRRADWSSLSYLAIDQLPIVCMVENYRSGLLWRLFMSDPDVRRGLSRAGLSPPPDYPSGFPEVVLPLLPVVAGGAPGGQYRPLPLELAVHPDSASYHIPYWHRSGGVAEFYFLRAPGPDSCPGLPPGGTGREKSEFAEARPAAPLLFFSEQARPGRNRLEISGAEADFLRRAGEQGSLLLLMRAEDRLYPLEIIFR